VSVFLRRLGISVLVAVLCIVLAAAGRAWWNSRLPATYDLMAYAVRDDGGGRHMAAMGGRVRVDALRAPAGDADRRFTLVARTADVRLASGRVVHALTFGGRAPGPELRVRQGDLVEVKLENADVRDGVTIHWHGVDVPNAEDGVAGVTQDAVLPGQSYTYRFRASRAGTFWYHSHQASDEEVRRGLYGVFVVEPRRPRAPGLDATVVAHDFEGRIVLGTSDGTTRRAVAPGAPVRLRLVNSENRPQRFAVAGTPFRVLAIDGTDVVGPTPLARTTLELAAGGRYDVGFTMPAATVALAAVGSGASLVLSPDGRGELVAQPGGAVFDPLAYGRPAPAPFDANSHFDRVFRLEIGRKLGFVQGRPGRHWSLNGRLFPRVPMFMVSRGDLVKVTLVNHSGAVHPMHLHGHHALVLSRNGDPVTGSPWWIDTLDVQAGETYELAFLANNPGIWMDHCHNLRHAAAGLTLHVAYEMVESPFRIGGSARNEPE
jgi:FtsP/CotA-like multicopper oxidase with cupredoxin domain